jgi:hypothetical protein
VHRLRANHLEQLTQGHRVRVSDSKNNLSRAPGIDYHLDFGSVKIAGIEEISTHVERLELLGTKNCTAPEYLLGTAGSHRSDLFSLGGICYEILNGQLPYSERLTQKLNWRTMNRINYTNAIVHNPTIPQWLNGALEKAVSLEPRFRYDTLSEFLFDLTHPNSVFMNRSVQLFNKYPNMIWKTLLLTSAVFNPIFIYLLFH